MTGRYFRILLCVVALVVLVPAAVAMVGCSSGSGSVAMMKKLPEDSDGFTFVDIAAMRDDDDLSDAYDQFKDEIKSRYDSLGISASDVDRMIMGGSVVILEGRFDLEDVSDELEDNDYDDDRYKDVDTFEGVMSVALVSEDCIVVGSSMNDVKDCIAVIKGDSDSLRQDEDISAVVDRVPGGIMVSASTSEYYLDCKAEAYSVAKDDSDTVRVTAVFRFTSEGAADDARSTIEADWESRDYYSGVEVTVDGEYVEATADVDIDDILDLL